MLTSKNRELLGMASETKKVRRPSAVSQALRAISNEIDGEKKQSLISGDSAHTDYHIRVASDRNSRQRAYALAHRVYREAGFAPSGSTLCVAPYDLSPQTLTLLAEDNAGNDCATISVVFDTSEGLPCDEIYRQEVDALRAQGCLMAEVTRLAINETCVGAKKLLLHLFNYSYIFSRIVRGNSDLIVEVNPRHVSYYQRILRFQQAGPQRPCSRVQGAPAVLLRLSFPEIEATVKGKGCTGGRDLNGRRLHRYPYSNTEEEEVAGFLAQGHKPMTDEDAQYFGLVTARTSVASRSNVQ